MRIGVNGRFYGAPLTGVQRVARELTERLCVRSDTVLLLPAGVAAPAPGARIARGRLPGHAWEQLELPRLARREGCDVVLQLSGGPGPLRGGPHVLLIHDVLPLTHPEWFPRAFAAWYRIALPRAARRAGLVLTVSEWSKREIRRVLGIAEDRIVVIPQGVGPFDRPAAAERVARVLARHDLPERYLLAVGGRDPRKNAGFLVDVLERWRARGGDPPALALVGAGAADPAAAAATREGTDLRVLGPVDDAELHALYTGALALCFPSRAEGFGRPPLEAMACATPAVVAPYAAAREVLGTAARIVPLRPDAWVDALDTIVRPDTDGRHTMRRGRWHARKFRWENAVPVVIDACRRAAGEHTGIGAGGGARRSAAAGGFRARRGRPGVG